MRTLKRTTLKLLSAMVLVSVALTGVADPARATPSLPTAPAAAQPTVVAIDLLLAGSYTDAARQAIVIWNRTVPTIQLVEQQTEAPLRVKEYKTASGTQSHAFPTGLGQGWVYLEVGDAKIYNPTRIVVHELGHILSLPDLGLDTCSKVMSGALAGPACVNDQPDAEEAAAVTDFFATHNLGDPIPGWGFTAGTAL